MFSNGSNIKGFSVTTGVTSNFSGAYLLQRRNSQVNGISAAVLGMDQTDVTDGPSRSYGGYFNRLYVEGLYKNVRVVTTSQTLLKTDCTIHCYADGDITLTLPTPDNAMIGMEIKVRKLGNVGTCYVTAHEANKIWRRNPETTFSLVDDDSFLFIWDGNYWVLDYNDN